MGPLQQRQLTTETESSVSAASIIDLVVGGLRDRKLNFESRSSRWGVVDPDGSSVGSSNRSGQSQSQPGAALVSATGVLQPHKPFEHSVALTLGNAWAVVIDTEDHTITMAFGGDRDAGLGMAKCIIEEVPHQAAEKSRVTGYLDGVDRRDIDLVAAGPRGLDENYVIQIGRVPSSRSPLIDSCQK